MTGALVAVSAALRRGRPSAQEAGLAAFYLVTLALGVILVAFFGSNVDLVRVLFCTVLAINVRGLLLIAGVSSVTLLLLAAIYRPMAVESFDPAFLRSIGAGGALFGISCRRRVQSGRQLPSLRNVAVDRADVAASGGGALLDQRTWLTMALNIAMGMTADYAGLLPSYHRNVPSGPAIVLAGGVLYGVSLIGAGRMRFDKKRAWRRTIDDHRTCSPCAANRARRTVVLPLPLCGAADKIKVVATFSVIADMVTNVAGDRVDLVTIVGPDGDCGSTSRPPPMCRKWPMRGSCS